MQAATFQLPWGSESMLVNLPEGWHLSCVMEPANLPGCGRHHSGNAA